MGEVMVWELGSRERIAGRNFKVWDLNARSRALQVHFYFLTSLMECESIMILSGIVILSG
jgi:hypothetical protein